MLGGTNAALAKIIELSSREMPRFLKHTTFNFGPLSHNPRYNFARNHALSIYGAEAIYSFIPKNACSTLRTSIAYANGCIESADDFNWIHKNNATFNASLSELAKAKYTFAILRCPYSRLASVYLDKIVSKNVVAWNLFDLMERTIDLDDLSFSDFVKCLESMPVRIGEIHWRQQSDFLVYKEYDDYFCLSEFQHAVVELDKKISLKIIDARSLTNHGIDQLKLIDSECFAYTPAREIAAMKKVGNCPSPHALFDERLMAEVATLYAEDFALYRDVIGEKGLLFSNELQKTGT